MSDSVKFIFKTLIKVPCYIMVAYFILNLFAFAHTYFKMLGFSYVVMQTAVENNYLPETEYQQLNDYLSNNSATSFCTNASILVDDPDQPSVVPAYGSAYSRRQYGETVCVGVQYNFRMIWPLMPLQADEVSTGQGHSAIDDWNNNAASFTANGDEVEDNGRGWNTVTIRYTVPGLKYYPDLSD